VPPALAAGLTGQLDEGVRLHAIALDLLAQAEHGDDSPVLAVSPAAETLDALAAELSGLSGDDAPSRAVCHLLQSRDLDEALAFSEAFAPEHLQLVGTRAETLAARVTTAGCLFVGATGATAFGDYVAGSNHVLPTGGAARYTAGLSVLTFLRAIHLVEYERDALAEVAPHIDALGGAEDLAAHVAAVRVRIPRAGP